jgi:alkaline phosphatase D
MAAEAVAVEWQMASDERFSRLVAEGVVDALPGRGHSVHVEVSGLRPARWYYYRFRSGWETSPVGRTRTAPTPRSRPPLFRFGFGSCQQFEQGFFVSLRYLAEEDVDLVIHLGDYIYESSWGSDLVRRHSAGEPRTLVDYRNRHAQYKTDADLQRLHAAAPWLVVWDDHEVDNDYADTRSEDLDPEFLRRRAVAYQAYFEHMPLPESARPRGPDMRLHSRTDIGRLARFHLLDTRQYRSWQACPRPGRGGSNIVDAGCAELFDADRTMLGTQQEAWLGAGLTEARDRWNVLGSSTLMARADPGTSGTPRYWTDAWDGYPRARERLLRHIEAEAVSSTLVLSGDAHTFYAADLLSDFADPGSTVVATEFNGSSVTSQGRPAASTEAILRANEHILLADSSRRGYAVVELRPEAAEVRLRAVDTVKRRDAQVSTLATFAVEAGRAGARRRPTG